MVDDTLGKKLYSAGWRQGTLLPGLPWSVVYDIDDPLSKIAKTFNRQNTNANQRMNLSGVTGLSLDGLGFAFGTRQGDYLVIASQDCDIVKKVNDEPNIIVMRAFITNNAEILSTAGGNSIRYFLLDRTRNLVADASVMTLLEKPVLLKFKPEAGIPDIVTQRRFARWLGHRFDRPAFDDNIVEAVIKPILDNLRQMRKDNDPALTALDTVQEIRLAKIAGNPPYEVKLLFIIPKSGLPDGGIALARLVSRMRIWFNPLAARLAAWDTLPLKQINVEDYLATEQIYLDHYTYLGQDIQGLPPPPHI